MSESQLVERECLNNEIDRLRTKLAAAEAEVKALREDALKTVDRMKAYAETVNADLINALERITRITQEANTLKIAGEAIDSARSQNK